MFKRVFAFLMILVLCMAPFVFSGDTYDQTVYSIDLGKTIIFYGTVDMSSDTVGNFYTQAIDITDINADHCYVTAVCSEGGTEDVNALVQYSQDKTTWLNETKNSAAIDGLDAIGTTTKVDTVDVLVGASSTCYKSFRYMCLKFDGQTGNPDITVTWYLVFQKRNDLGKVEGKAKNRISDTGRT